MGGLRQEDRNIRKLAKVGGGKIYSPYTYGNKVEYAEDDYETEENNIIPAGYSVITALISGYFLCLFSS